MSLTAEKWFHLKPLTPTHPGGAVLEDTLRGGRRKVGVRELEGRKVGGGRGGKEERGGVRKEGRQDRGLM